MTPPAPFRITEAEVSIIMFFRATGIGQAEAIRRLSSPVEQDPETLLWRRKRGPVETPEGWRVVG